MGLLNDFTDAQNACAHLRDHIRPAHAAFVTAGLAPRDTQVGTPSRLRRCADEVGTR